MYLPDGIGQKLNLISNLAVYLTRLIDTQLSWQLEYLVIS